MILGKPKGYNDLGSKKSELDILFKIVGKPKFPILADVDCGHTVPIITLPIGTEIEMNAQSREIIVL